MKYLIAIVEEGTPIEELRTLGDHQIFDSFAADLDERTKIAAIQLREKERREIPPTDDFEIVRIPLDGAERLQMASVVSADILGKVGPV